MQLITNQAAVTLINSIAKTAAKFSRDVQTAAIAAIGYSLLHGDITIGQRLVDAMPKSVRKDSLVAFLEKHGAFAWSTADKKLNHYKRDDVEFNDEYLAMLEGDSWFNAIKAPELKSRYDVSVEIDKVFKRLDRLASNATVIVTHQDLLKRLHATSAAYWAEQYAEQAAVKEEKAAVETEEVTIPELKVA